MATTRNSTKCKVSDVLFRILLFIYIGAIAYLCFAKMNNLPQIQNEFFGIPTDKLVHFCMFFPFPIIAFYAYDRRLKTRVELVSSLVKLCAWGCIFAGVTEMVQATLPYRSQDVKDFAADCIAIGISSLILLIINLIKFKKK